MKSMAFSILAMALLLGACASISGAPLNVGSVIAQHEALDDKRVRLVGWVKKCWGYNCQITEFPNQDGRSILIGASRDFDEATARFDGYEIQIELEATVRKTCFDHSKDPGGDPLEIVICTDRANQLSNPVIVRVLQKRAFKTNEED